MTSDETTHMARCVGGDLWVVSWLPGRTLTGKQAVTAMTIATTTATREIITDVEMAMLDELALELGLTAREAMFMVAAENHDYRRTVEPRRRALG
ncbi:hypothetical protein ACWEKT_05675 [Nocardia takedensis]|uniref:hypothetical protein n=1 Tax=Nocardia takedensis TaxID=259390 RepID=UPI000683F3C0|nr:hypothetical protein [Nocardia takedensis]